MKLIATHRRTLQALTYREGVFLLDGERLDASRVMEMDAAGLLRWHRGSDRELVASMAEELRNND